MRPPSPSQQLRGARVALAFVFPARAPVTEAQGRLSADLRELRLLPPPAGTALPAALRNNFTLRRVRDPGLASSITLSACAAGADIVNRDGYLACSPWRQAPPPRVGLGPWQ